MENNQLTVYRKGGLPIEEITKITGQEPQVKLHSSSNPAAPGMLKSHYAPRKPFFLADSHHLPQASPIPKRAFLRFQQPAKDPFAKQLLLSPSRKMSEAAQNLFAFLRQLDNMDIDEIWAELVPETGLGRAINDRLRRAAAQ